MVLGTGLGLVPGLFKVVLPTTLVGLGLDDVQLFLRQPHFFFFFFFNNILQIKQVRCTCYSVKRARVGLLLIPSLF